MKGNKTMKYVQHKFTPTEWHPERWLSDWQHKYTLQNHLLATENFPLYFYKTSGKSAEGQEDFVDSFYEDRARNWPDFYANVDPELVKKSWESLTPAKMLFMLQQLYPDKNIVGYRLVRFTNVGNGYPCNRLDIFGKGSDTPEMEYGPNFVYNDCPEGKDKAIEYHSYHSGWDIGPDW
jgi:hypothetical protein